MSGISLRRRLVPLLGSAALSTALAAQTSDPRFDALATMVEARMKQHGIPGVALGVIADGKVMVRGLGITSVEDSLPVTAHTVFPIASISKTFAATAMMRLVEQGKVNLDAPVRTYVPDFRVRDDDASRIATVRQLLTHLGGWEGQVSGPDRGTETLANFVASMTDLMQVAPPGAAWSYNNAGFSFAGRVIERVTGMPINRAIKSLVFDPLQLEHAGTHANDFITQRFAVGHSVRDGVPRLLRPFGASTSITAGGVGVCMTDLLAYAQFHMSGAAASSSVVLSAASLEAMRTPQMRKQSTDDDMGIGWHLRNVGGVRTASHGGTLGGHILLLELAPERRFAIAILTNANTGWRLIQDVEREALRTFLGATYRRNQAIAHRGLVESLPWAQPLPTQPDPAPYVGSYARPSNTVDVRREGTGLVVQERQSSGTGEAMPIAFFGTDQAIVTEGTAQGQTIEFIRDASGRVQWVRVVGRVAVRTS